jgi:fatty acid desaturase
MEEKAKLLESLVEKATDYGKVSLEVVKLKAVDKTSDIVSSVVPHTVVVIIMSSFMLFLNLGLAFWLGDLTGRLYFGFFIIAAFYVLIGIVIHFLMHKSLKKLIRNYVIEQLLK